MILKDQIVRHYDELSPFYKDVWGIHIHHGYWTTGTETIEEAQEQLIKELVSRAKIKTGSRILDVGCGLGGSAIFLSRTLSAHVVGITISQNQVDIGSDLAERCYADVCLLRMDAEALQMDDRFDIIWSVEAISHLSNKRSCFQSIAHLLTKDGKLVIADWFKSHSATPAQERKFLHPIERAMLLPRLETPSTYADYISQAGLNLTSFDDWTANVKKTWELAIDLIRNPALWKLAAAHGKDFWDFLEGFAAMKAGYKSGALIYGALVAQKPS